MSLSRSLELRWPPGSRLRLVRRFALLRRLNRNPPPEHIVKWIAGRGYTHRDVSLAGGDLLFFYTDGCVESENEADEMFGADRLEALLMSIGASGPSMPDRLLQQVEEAVTSFRGTREPGDDATMMAVRIG